MPRWSIRPRATPPPRTRNRWAIAAPTCRTRSPPASRKAALLGAGELPRHGVRPRHVGHVRLVGIAIDEGPGVERILRAADFVLDHEQRLFGVEVDDVGEPELMLVAELRDEAAFLEPGLSGREVLDVDLHVMAVIRRQFAVALAEQEGLVLTDRDARGAAGLVLNLAHRPLT